MLTWLRTNAALLAVLAIAAGWGAVEHCRAAGLASDLAKARAEVAMRDAALADQEARYEADLALVEDRARIETQRDLEVMLAESERAAADAEARAKAAAALRPIEADERARVRAAERGELADEVNRRIDAGLLPGGER